MRTEKETRQVLRHLSRLRRDGEALLRDRPLDELAQAMWSDRADKYLRRRLPEARHPRMDELTEAHPPDLLDPGYEPPDPTDAAVARARMGQKLIRRQLALIAGHAERLEIGLERRANGPLPADEKAGT